MQAKCLKICNFISFIGVKGHNIGDRYKTKYVYPRAQKALIWVFHKMKQPLRSIRFLKKLAMMLWEVAH